MDISKFTISDFVFDKSFRDWVFGDDPDLESHWQKLIRDNPGKRDNITTARKILIDYQNNGERIDSTELRKIWEKIDLATKRFEYDFLTHNTSKESNSQLRAIIPRRSYAMSQWKSVAAILIMVFGLGLLINYFQFEKITAPETVSVILEKIETEKGTKSTFVLQDGTEVMVNAGSHLQFKKGFDADQRKIFLKGEAYFKVARDTLKPFTVVSSENISVTALGTSFMIQAYSDEEMKVSLLTGKVKINLNQEKDPIYLEKGEGLKINTATKQTIKHQLNMDQVLAWTKKTLYFDKMPISEAIRTLENWYGVQIYYKNNPPSNLLLTGTFEDETLKNVLEGLKYTSGIQYKLE
ncbi:MAG: FecR domain-containing protein, partial [Cyclobacteriaceae bacterium]